MSKPHFRKVRGQWQVMWRDGAALKIRDIPFTPGFWMRSKGVLPCTQI